MEEWRQRKDLAAFVLSGDLEAFAEAIQELNPFESITNVGSEISFQLHSSRLASVDFEVNGEHVIPNEIKSLSTSGKLTAKKMPQGRFYELYQDHVCSAALRIALELFSILPLDTILVTACAKTVNPQTGHLDSTPVLSVLIPRSTLEQLNLDQIDPSDSMRNFKHNMGFKRAQGFYPVSKLDPENL